MVDQVNWLKQKFDSTETGTGISIKGKIKISPSQISIPFEKEIPIR